MTPLFIAGIHTDIGKTFVTAQILRQLRARGLNARALKPVISGYDENHPEGSDSAILLDAAGELATPEMIAGISPWRYAAPLAPNMAARLEGKRVDFNAVVAFCRDAVTIASGPLLIEGIGGVMSPVSDDKTVLDWIVALKAAVVLMSGTYLGAISHTLTALEALRSRGIAPSSVIVNESQNGIGLAETMATLAEFTDPVIGLTRPPLKEIGLDQIADFDALAR